MERICGWCENEGRWLQFIDHSPADTIWRQFYGMPGPTAEPIAACNDHKELLDRDRFHPEHQPRLITPKP